MPTIMIKVNVDVGDAEKKAIIEDITEAVCDSTSKPRRFVQVGIETCTLSFGGSMDPGAYVVSRCPSSEFSLCLAQCPAAKPL